MRLHQATKARIAATALLLGISAVGGRASAQCTLSSEATAVRSVLWSALSCDQQALRGPAVACVPTAAPACSGTLTSDVRALVYGPNDPASQPLSTSPWLFKPQLDCQTAIAQSASNYVYKRLTGLTLGLADAQIDAVAVPLLAPILTSCSGVPVVAGTTGTVAPAVGPQCAAAVGAPGSLVDASALRGCMQTLLDVWVDRVGPHPQPLRPNIVLILTDDQRWDTLDSTHSPFGTDIMPLVRSEMEASGVAFSQAYATTPLCAPSRSTILTGQYVHETGVLINEAPYGAVAFDDSSTVATALEDAGYRTGFYGKYLNAYESLWAAGSAPYVPPGWSEWHAFETPQYGDYNLIENGVKVHYGHAAADYSTDVLRDKAVSFIHDSSGTGQPFFLFLSIYGPHAPTPPAARHAGLFSSLLPFRPPSYNEADVSDKPSWFNLFPQLTSTQQSDLDTFRINQLEALQAVDEAVGSPEGVIQALRDDHIDQDTIVVFMSDHGYLWGEHRLKAKTRVYEEDVRIPLVVRYPRLVPLPKAAEPRFALNTDIVPTFLELAGATPLPGNGASLLRVLDGSGTAWRSDFLMEDFNTGPKGGRFAAVHTDHWVYAEYGNGQKELYDLAVDPFQLTSVHASSQNAALVTTMAARLRQLRPTWPGDLPP